MVQIDPTDMNLITGKPKMGKTHFVRAFLIPHLREQGVKVKYHRNPTEIKSLRSGFHHVIDDFDKVPLKQLSQLMSSVQQIALAGRHSGTGLTIIVHHPTWTAKEFRLTPANIFAFRTPSGAGYHWFRPLLGKGNAELLIHLPKTYFIWQGDNGIYLCQLIQQGGRWELKGVRPDLHRVRQLDRQPSDGLDGSQQ